MPFLVALMLGSIILGWDYHRRHAALARVVLRVAVEGAAPDGAIEVEINGRRHNLDEPAPIGFAKISVHARGTETKRLAKFIWYGVTDLGKVDLPRSRGSITARLAPQPDRYELSGKGGNWTNASGVFENVPVGAYRLRCRFGPLFQDREVEAKRNDNVLVQDVAPIGSLELSAEPSGGEFELLAEGGKEGRTGKFPATFDYLRAGSYQLISKRSDYRREWKVEILPNQTNRFAAKFAYGGVHISTTPESAIVLMAGRELGTTPLTLPKVVPGEYQIEVRLEGHDPLSAVLKVEEEREARFAATLVNTRHREAMAEAHKYLGQNNFDNAQRRLEAALVALPGDEEAMRLLPGTRARALVRKAEELAGRNEFDGALDALESALKDIPNDAGVKELQANMSLAKTEFEKKTASHQFEQLIAESKTAATAQKFYRALDLLGRARKIFPNNSEIDGLEASYQEGRLRFEAEDARLKRLEEVAARKYQFMVAFNEMMKSEKDAQHFQLVTWQTEKSAAEVRDALWRMGKDDWTFPVKDMKKLAPHMFTAKLGEIAPRFLAGTYIRIAAVTYDEERTEIRWKLFRYSGGVPETRESELRRYSERFKAKLTAALGSELK